LKDSIIFCYTDMDNRLVEEKFGLDLFKRFWWFCW